jgi:hypothetical protein
MTFLAGQEERYAASSFQPFNLVDFSGFMQLRAAKCDAAAGSLAVQQGKVNTQAVDLTLGEVALQLGERGAAGDSTGADKVTHAHVGQAVEEETGDGSDDIVESTECSGSDDQL